MVRRFLLLYRQSKVLAEPFIVAGNVTDAREPPYIRYVAPDEEELDCQVEYDLEDDDVAWLAETRRSVTRSLRQGLTEDIVERLIDRFEKGLHAAVVRQPHLWSSAESSCGKGHLDLDVAALYPLDKALQVTPAPAVPGGVAFGLEQAAVGTCTSPARVLAESASCLRSCPRLPANICPRVSTAARASSKPGPWGRQLI